MIGIQQSSFGKQTCVAIQAFGWYNVASGITKLSAWMLYHTIDAGNKIIIIVEHFSCYPAGASDIIITASLGVRLFATEDL